MSNNASEQPFTQEQIPDIPLSEQKPIEKNRNEIIFNRTELKDFVEPPLLKACEDLYDKNIRTLETSANKKNLASKYAYINIDVTSMSPENTLIAQGIAQKEEGDILEYDGKQVLVVKIPIKDETTTSEIEEQSVKLASMFKKQPLTWSSALTIAQLKKVYGRDESKTEYNNPQIWIDEGFYYDKESDRFYLSEEHFKKIRDIQ